MSTIGIGFGAPILAVYKQCSCGLNHTRESWSRLPLVGVQDLGDGRRASIRNCVCGSSLLRELAGKPTIRMAAVDVRAILDVDAAVGARS